MYIFDFDLLSDMQLLNLHIYIVLKMSFIENIRPGVVHLKLWPPRAVSESAGSGGSGGICVLRGGAGMCAAVA